MLRSTKVSRILAHELTRSRINTECCDNPSHQPFQQLHHRRQRQPPRRWSFSRCKGWGIHISDFDSILEDDQEQQIQQSRHWSHGQPKINNVQFELQFNQHKTKHRYLGSSRYGCRRSRLSEQFAGILVWLRCNFAQQSQVEKRWFLHRRACARLSKPHRATIRLLDWDLFPANFANCVCFFGGTSTVFCGSGFRCLGVECQ